MILKKLKQKYNQLLDFLEDVEKTKGILLVPKGLPMAPSAQQLVNERCDARSARHEAESSFIDLKNFIDNLAVEIQKDIDYNDRATYYLGEPSEVKESRRARLSIILAYIQTIQQRAKIIESGVTDFYPDGGIDDVDYDRFREECAKSMKKVEA